MGCGGGSKTKEEQKVYSKATFILTHSNQITQDYYYGNVLGKGTFGKVMSCVHKISKQKRAVKIISKKLLETDEIFKKLLKSELDALRLLDNQHIMKIYETYEDDLNIYIITEILEGGELYDRILENDYIDEKLGKSIIRQILLGLAYCHENNLAHRDLKPENIMIESSENEIWFVKLVDFGFAKMFNPKKKFNEFLGSPMYIAPEIIEGKEYDTKCDIWSLGIIIYTMLSGMPPFTANNKVELYSKIISYRFSDLSFRGNIWESISINAKDFLLKLLVYNPDIRATAKELLSHKWFLEEDVDTQHPSLNNDIKLEIMQNLKQFKTTNHLQQAILMYAAHNLTENKDIVELRKIFEQLDVTHDGLLSHEELKMGYGELKEIFMFEEELDTLIKDLDTNNNEQIDYTEFITATMNRNLLMTKKNLKIAFDAFDTDGDGFITNYELQKLFDYDFMETKMCKIMTDEMIKDGDINKDSKISFSEFEGVMKATISKYELETEIRGNNAAKESIDTQKLQLYKL